MEIGRDGGTLIFDEWEDEREAGAIQVRLASTEEGPDFFLEVRFRDDDEAQEEGAVGPWSEWKEYDVDDELGIGSTLVQRLGELLAAKDLS